MHIRNCSKLGIEYECSMIFIGLLPTNINLIHFGKSNLSSSLEVGCACHDNPLHRSSPPRFDLQQHPALHAPIISFPMIQASYVVRNIRLLICKSILYIYKRMSLTSLQQITRKLISVPTVNTLNDLLHTYEWGLNPQPHT